MKTVLKYLGAAVVSVLAAYGAYALLSAHLTAAQGRQVVESPFVQGAASAAGEKLKEAIKNTPDKKLEKDSEELSEKLYPIGKGAIKGQLEAILKDANRKDVPEKMYETGKDVSGRVVAPLVKGLADGSNDVLKELDKTLQGIQTFREKNKDLIDSIASGIATLKKNHPSLPPLPVPPGLRGAIRQPPAPAPPQSSAPSDTP